MFRRFMLILIYLMKSWSRPLNPMRILGIDPGLRVCGYGLIENSSGVLKVLEAGVITTNPKQTLQQRLDEIYRSLAELITESKPDVMILEKLYAHHRHPATAFLLGHARGVICLLCAQYKLGLVEYLPTRIKKAIVGNGHAGKLQIKNMIERLLNIKGGNYLFDVTDALALAVAHAYIAALDKRKR